MKSKLRRLQRPLEKALTLGLILANPPYSRRGAISLVVENFENSFVRTRIPSRLPRSVTLPNRPQVGPSRVVVLEDALSVELLIHFFDVRAVWALLLNSGKVRPKAIVAHAIKVRQFRILCFTIFNLIEIRNEI